MLRNLAAANELPDEFVFEFELNFRIHSLHSRVQGGLWAVRSVREDCLERCQSSEDGTSTLVALVQRMDETLVCEELLPLYSRLSQHHGLLFHE